MNLSAIEQRVLGCLLEKEVTTPDIYPLSLNALTTACNQKTNREPVMSLSEQQVLDVLTQLEQRHLVTQAFERGSRVAKYKHRFCNTEFGSLKLSDQEKAILCMLFLRGPQTPGELRTRCHRLYEFSDVHQVEQVLDSLATREQALVRQLPREAGKRECRWMHLLGDATYNDVSDTAQASATQLSHDSDNNQRIVELELQVKELKQHIERLEARIDALEN
jgi:hypothetical protein